MTASNPSAAALDRYLERFAEPVAQPGNPDHESVMAQIRHAYRWVIVVPAFDEPGDFPARLVSNIDFPRQQHALLILRIINAPADAAEAARKRTLATLPHTSAPANAPTQTTPETDTSTEPRANSEPDRNQAPHLSPVKPGIDVLTIDAATVPLPAEQATGLARKLGNDIACALHRCGRVKTPLLCNTDADAVLPGDYFQRLAHALTVATAALPGTEANEPAAWILPFEHRGKTQLLDAAGQDYELYLRSMYLQLDRCGSPYAYPALGSVLAVNPLHYAKSRGFPKRRAGEDFYLLNKLAKLADVIYLNGAPITLDARASTRVPFGTGPAIEAALNGEPANTWAQASYDLLARFYSGFPELHWEPHESTADAASQRHSEPLAWQDPDLKWLLKRLGVANALVRLQRNHRSSRALKRGMHEWFDALKIVRFLNAARHFHADEPLLPQLERLFDQPDHQASSDVLNALRAQDIRALNQALEGTRQPSVHGLNAMQPEFTPH